MGTSRGGKNSQNTYFVQLRRDTIEFILAGSEVDNVKVAPELLDMHLVTGLIADKAYGSKEGRYELEWRNISIGSPPKSNTAPPWSYDPKFDLLPEQYGASGNFTINTLPEDRFL